MARVSFNKISIENKLGKSLTQRKYQGLAASAANTRFLFAKQDTLKEFDEHTITNELKEGANAENSVLGYGNLASFAGLPDSAQSVAQVRSDLELGIKMDRNPRFVQNKSNVTYVFNIEAPTLQEIYDKNPPPPDSYNKSWISLIENGMGNFSYFVFRLLGLPGSRSGTGLQRETKRKWIDVPNSSPKFPWISEILNNFLSRFSRR